MEELTQQLPVAAPLSTITLLINLLIGLVLSVVLSKHFERFGSTLSNRTEFALVFPFIILTTTLIITVVKTSLALSLGLVGALSIVRFRTPIKEPEELAYLFLAIAMGLGLGADQTVPTVSATMLILLLVAILRWVRSGKETRNLYLSIEISEGDQPSEHLNRLNEVIGRHTESSDLRRMDKRPEGLEFTFLLDLDESHQLASLVEELNGSFPGIGLTFIDQNQLPAL